MAQYEALKPSLISRYQLTITTKNPSRDYWPDRTAIVDVACRRIVWWEMKGSFSSLEMRPIRKAIHDTLVKEGLIDKESKD